MGFGPGRKSITLQDTEGMYHHTKKAENASTRGFFPHFAFPLT